MELHNMNEDIFKDFSDVPNSKKIYNKVLSFHEMEKIDKCLANKYNIKS